MHQNTCADSHRLSGGAPVCMCVWCTPPCARDTYAVEVVSCVCLMPTRISVAGYVYIHVRSVEGWVRSGADTRTHARMRTRSIKATRIVTPQHSLCGISIRCICSARADGMGPWRRGTCFYQSMARCDAGSTCHIDVSPPTSVPRFPRLKCILYGFQYDCMGLS